MRPEQLDAVNKTAHYFNAIKQDKKQSSHTAFFYGMPKCDLAKLLPPISLPKKMNWQRVLILTFKPAVKKCVARRFDHAQ